MGVDPSEIYNKQYEALKEHGIEVLSRVLYLFERDNHNDIRKMLNQCSVPCDDGLKSEKNFIDFEFTENTEGDDINDLLIKLHELKLKSVIS